MRRFVWRDEHFVITQGQIYNEPVHPAPIVDANNLIKKMVRGRLDTPLGLRDAFDKYTVGKIAGGGNWVEVDQILNCSISS